MHTRQYLGDRKIYYSKEEIFLIRIYLTETVLATAEYASLCNSMLWFCEMISDTTWRNGQPFQFKISDVSH